MGFSLKLKFTDILVPGSMQNYAVNCKLSGYRFDVRLRYYRGHYLSDIEKLKIILDSQSIPEEDINFYFHGKFHHILEDDTERSIPDEKILPVIAEANFDGYIVSEYENHVSGLAPEMVKKHIAMERRILGQ